MAFINKPSIVTFIVAGGDTFPFEFKWYDETDIQVFYVPVGMEPDDDVHKLSPSDYTITSNASRIGGAVQITIPMVDGSTVTIRRVLPVTRTTDYATRGNFSALTVNEDQNYQTYLMLDLFYYSNYFLRAPVSGGVGGGLTFPPPFPEAYIRWNLAGDGLVNDLEPATWRTETEALRDETQALKDASQVSSDESAVSATASEVSKNFSREWSSQSEDVEVDDGVNPAGYSAFHWSRKAQSAAQGLIYIGPWDATVGTEPPPPTGGYLPSQFWIVNVAGNGLFIGDWIIRNQTNDGFDYISSETDWDSIKNVPRDVTHGYNPIGAIIMFNGTFANIPTNWQLCDGTNGTPDMVNSFIMGTNTESDIGDAVGGNDAVLVSHTHTFTGDLMPTHGHSLRVSNDPNAAVGSDTRSLLTETNIPDQIVGTSAGTPSGTISTDGVSGTNANIPKSYKMAYIQRMS